MSGLTLDTGGLIAIDRGDRRLVRAAENGVKITIPAAALAQAIRSPARQVRLTRLIRMPAASVIAMDARDATAVGLLLARSGTSDVVAAYVVVCARRAAGSVVTSDPKDLRRLAPDLEVVAI